MTADEWAVLIGFLVSGLLVGTVAGWMDQFADYIKRK